MTVSGVVINAIALLLPIVGILASKIDAAAAFAVGFVSVTVIVFVALFEISPSPSIRV